MQELAWKKSALLLVDTMKSDLHERKRNSVAAEVGDSERLVHHRQERSKTTVKCEDDK